MTWQDALEEFLDRKSGKWEPTTTRYYESQLRLLADWCVEHSITLEAFRQRHMERYMGFRRETVSRNTVRKDVDCARVFTRFWAAEGIFKTDPLREIELPKREEPYVPVPTAEEMDALMLAIEKKQITAKHRCNHIGRGIRSFLKARDTTVVLLAAETGLRISELCRLTTQDCDLIRSEVVSVGGSEVIKPRPVIYVRRSKSKKPRAVPVTTALAAQIEGYVAIKNRQSFAAQTNALFPNLCGHAITRDGMHKQIDRYWEAAGIEPKTFHSLRHWAARWLTRKGSIKTAQAVLGHARIETTARYARLDDDAIREDVEAVGMTRMLLDRLPRQQERRAPRQTRR